MERGPVPIHFEDAVSELIEENKIRPGKRRLPCGKVMNRYFSLKEPSIEINQDELDIINEVIRKLSHMNGKQIGEYSLEDSPVKQTEENEIIEYDLVSSRGSNNDKRKVYVKIN